MLTFGVDVNDVTLTSEGILSLRLISAGLQYQRLTSFERICRIGSSNYINLTVHVLEIKN